MALSTTEWAARIAKQVGEQVEHFRSQGGSGRTRLTTKALADRCTELGLPMDRAVIAKLEKGQRQTITLGEILVLAKALEVPPLLLAFPVGRDSVMEVLPERTVDTWDAAHWFTGEAALDREEVDAWRTVNAAAYYRAHDQRVRDWKLRRNDVEHWQKKAAQASTESEGEAHAATAEARQELLARDEDVLIRQRRLMRKLDMAPPALPDALAHLEEEDREATTPQEEPPYPDVTTKEDRLGE